MIRIILPVLVLLAANPSSAAEQVCDARSEAKVEKAAKKFLAKIKAIEPKYKSIKWDSKSIPPSRCLPQEAVSDAGISCAYECDANNGGSGLKMKISMQGQLLGFTSYEP